MSSKRKRKPPSMKSQLAKVGKSFVRDPETGKILFRPTDPRFLSNVTKKANKSPVPENRPKASEAGSPGSIERAPDHDPKSQG